MNEVMEKTRELGLAILNSDIYKEMKAAEDKAMENAQAAAVMGEYLEHRAALENLMQQNKPDADKMSEESRAMEELQAQLNQISDIMAMGEKRAAFTEMINQVNGLLKTIITGEEPTEGGCTGSCSTCGGCCHYGKAPRYTL